MSTRLAAPPADSVGDVRGCEAVREDRGLRAPGYWVLKPLRGWPPARCRGTSPAAEWFFDGTRDPMRGAHLRRRDVGGQVVRNTGPRSRRIGCSMARRTLARRPGAHCLERADRHDQATSSARSSTAACRGPAPEGLGDPIAGGSQPPVLRSSAPELRRPPGKGAAPSPTVGITAPSRLCTSARTSRHGGRQLRLVCRSVLVALPRTSARTSRHGGRQLRLVRRSVLVALPRTSARTSRHGGREPCGGGCPARHAQPRTSPSLQIGSEAT